MTHFDVFNGDADGLCALHQLRLAFPREAILVTGAKRDIALLDRVAATPGDTVTVFDVSLASNRQALLRLLREGVQVEYFDHHFADAIPAHPGLTAHIDLAPDVCTGIIVDRVLNGAFRAWAVVAAYGDNLHASAQRLGRSLELDDGACAALRALGDDLAYNAYGDDEADLIVPPAELYRMLRPYRDPFAFLAGEDAWQRIRTVREDDLAHARATTVHALSHAAAIVHLPDAPWSRRVRGALANELAHAFPQRAHAVVTEEHTGCFTVSVRAPVARPTGADRLCRAFPAGGGRAAAAGINHLPASELDRFMHRFRECFP